MGEAATFAVIRLSEVDELEVEAEGARELVCGREIERTNAGERLLKIRRSGGLVGCPALRGFGFAAGNCDAAKGFDSVVERITGLLTENFAEQHAERADIAP
jgi:hypothetical protein